MCCIYATQVFTMLLMPGYLHASSAKSFQNRILYKFGVESSFNYLQDQVACSISFQLEEGVYVQQNIACNWCLWQVMAIPYSIPHIFWDS